MEEARLPAAGFLTVSEFPTEAPDALPETALSHIVLPPLSPAKQSQMLREILTPSAEISDQFQTHSILTSAGELYQGKIINQTESTLTVATDPKRPSGIVQIPVADVEEMIPSKVSMMPKDLLNTLTLDDVLDLLAFIESGGDPAHANFAN